ncbi:MAG: copper resistance protein NlpE [Bacteroidales bacterium]|nr:MAG: copper resistance protein NlpE [Bacteroidales bacterium]
MILLHLIAALIKNTDRSMFFSSRHISTVIENKVCLCSFAGTYCGVLSSDVETTLTLNADGTYLLIQTFKGKQHEQEKLRGSFHMLDGNILMLAHPSSGDNIFYKVRENKSVILLDSFGNEPQNVDKKNYTLKMKK